MILDDPLLSDPAFDQARLSAWQAAIAGELAFKRGQPITDNPHPRNKWIGPTPFTAWNAGYTRARAESERRARDAIRKKTKEHQRYVKR